MARQESWPALPLLLVIAMEYAQERRIRSVMAELAAVDRRVVKRAFSCRTTTLERLATRGPLAAIWWPIRWPPDEDTTPGEAAEVMEGELRELLANLAPLPMQSEDASGGTQWQ